MTFVQGAGAPPTNTFLPNFLALQNEVLNYGFNDGPQVYRGRIKNWLNEGQHRVARQIEGSEFQVQLALQLVPGIYQYNLPSDFLRLQDVTYPVLATRLRVADLQQFDMTNPLVSGPPGMYLLYQRQIWLFPNPNQADTLLLHYLQNPPDMVNDTDVPQLNPNYYDLLVTYAVIKAFEAEDDYEAAQYFQGKWQRDLAAYATDVQNQSIDRPRQIDGTWAGGNYGTRSVI